MLRYADAGVLAGAQCEIVIPDGPSGQFGLDLLARFEWGWFERALGYQGRCSDQ
jgi:hypothetical protein